jgi:hypothetical protein
MSRTLFSSDAWAAFCAACGKKLSDYDWTADEARQLGESAPHDCPRDQQMRLSV